MLPEQPVERHAQVGRRRGRRLEREHVRRLLGDAGGERVALVVHVGVRLAGEVVGLRVVLLRVGVELALQLHDVHGQALLEHVLREVGRLGEEAGERAGVTGEILDRLLLRGPVLRGKADGVVDEVADVVSPEAGAVEELLRSLVPVDGTDRLGELDAVGLEPPRRPRSPRHRRIPSARPPWPGRRARRGACRA